MNKPFIFLSALLIGCALGGAAVWFAYAVPAQDEAKALREKNTFLEKRVEALAAGYRY